MKQSSKVLLNTGTLYIQIIITTIVTIVSTRIALNALGVDSFGLYNLIAGIIVLLSFLNGALLISTQRFLSIAIGEKNYNKLSAIFNVSIFIHILLAFLLGLGFILIKPYLFNGLLNIKPEMLYEAERVYEIMIISSIVTLFTVPFNSVINAREEMWFFAFSEIIISLLKLFAAIYIMYAKDNLLTTYTFLMLVAIIAGTLSKYLWCRFRYKEAKIIISKLLNKQIFNEMIGFIGWNTLGSFAVVVRNQGIAVVLNLFFGTVINAAYGIANNLNSMVLIFASTLTTVFTPMIIQAKGEGNNKKMLFVSILSSKMSFFLSSIIAIPALLFTPFILEIWLSKVPEYTVILSRLIILSFLVLQIYPGINRSIYASGNIKWYQIMISIVLVSIIPIGFFILKLGAPPHSILIIMFFAQLATLFITVYFAKKHVGLNAKDFLYKSFINPVIIFIICLLFGFIISNLLDKYNEWFNFMFVSLMSIALYSIFYYKIIFNTEETNLLTQLIHRLKIKY